jgi:hypothetical protein
VLDAPLFVRLPEQVGAQAGHLAAAPIHPARPALPDLRNTLVDRTACIRRPLVV